ncbi:MAG: hypothetical protein U9P90_03610 [Patescibacteria group bacterium]|nr:hypothetical protein [Patescibacteria group bacterium]
MLGKLIMTLKAILNALYMLYRKLSQNKILGVVVILVLMAFVYSFCGCAPDLDMPDVDDVVVEDDDYETIAGVYNVHVLEIENTCDTSDDVKDRIDAQFWMTVNVQEAREDGSYLADLTLADLVWYDVEVTPTGIVEAMTDIYGIWENWIVGTLTPEELVATVTLYTLDTNGDIMCYIVYEFDGYSLFERAEPPERFALVDDDEIPLLPPVPDWAVDMVL